MKRTFFLLPLLLAFNVPATTTVKIQKQTAAKALNALNQTYNYIENSELPHKDVIQLEALIKEAFTALDTDMKDSLLQK